MSTIDEKLEIVANKFRKGSKRYLAARYIVKKNREIPKNEKEAICQEIPIASKTLQDLFTKLKKMRLYPPQEPIEISEEPTYHPQETQIPSNPEYVTVEDLNSFKQNINESIKYLANVINSGVVPESPLEEEQELEPILPDEMSIRDPSLTRKSIWLKPKTQMYFDLSRQGIFANYAGSSETGPFMEFRGNLSDFFNIIVDDYFIRNYNADIGLLMRRYIT